GRSTSPSRSRCSRSCPRRCCRGRPDAGARPGRPGAAGEDGTGHGLQTRMGTGWRDFPGARRYRVWRPLRARPGEQGTAQGAPARRGEREREGSVLMGDTGIGADPGADDRAEHVPVMLDRIVELLAPALQEPGAVLVDGTLGLGGHAEAMLTALPGLRLVGIDRDTSALRRSRARLAPFACHTALARADCDARREVLGARGIGGVRGVRRVVGVYSPNLGDAGRGFGYSGDAWMAMRIDRTLELAAAEVGSG